MQAVISPWSIQQKIDIQQIPHHRCSISRCPFSTLTKKELCDYYLTHRVCPFRSLEQWSDQGLSKSGVILVGTGCEIAERSLSLSSGLESLYFNVLNLLGNYKKQLFHPELYFCFCSQIEAIGENYEVNVATRVLFRPRANGLIVLEDKRDSPPPRECFVLKKFKMEKLTGIYSFSSAGQAGIFLKSVEVGIAMLGYLKDIIEPTFDR